MKVTETLSHVGYSRGERRRCGGEAASSSLAKSASPRELKRWYSAALRTGAGTAASIAAAIVHRRSPESETLPSKPARLGSLMSAAAVKSGALLSAMRHEFGGHRREKAAGRPGPP